MNCSHCPLAPPPLPQGAAPDTLATLRRLESQIGQFLQENGEDDDFLSALPSDLETITEEEFSTASSNFGSKSPTPPPPPPPPPPSLPSDEVDSWSSDPVGAALQRMNSSVLELEQSQSGSAATLSGGERGGKVDGVERARRLSSSSEVVRVCVCVRMLVHMYIRYIYMTCHVWVNGGMQMHFWCFCVIWIV